MLAENYKWEGTFWAARDYNTINELIIIFYKIDNQPLNFCLLFKKVSSFEKTATRPPLIVPVHWSEKWIYD
jgi:hypothetical protein